ncbi:energy-coupling factor ABC transporter ATP-binding protein [Brevibacillus ruminantium]|uniref:Energy-coupling factor ABC transporter ATP-binding protein n=1 Tax=Brevibacillus ruminantium TaxID=2950604 RepID=A0ABY4WHR7_9BACL|nr:ABC transporter ATP-binding protein [Brevibacillus ruminantium]USG66695.1 energy-coupling factor ABC transporter ATP-binding protein [Brevibacillus ruminantium]
MKDVNAKATASETTELLRFSDVRYTYPGAGHPALSGLSLTVPQGKKCVLLGHNGCGKSTLFLHANGILRPQHGEVLWKGSPIGNDRASLFALKQRIGLVFQDPEQQLIATTVAEDLSYGLCNLKLPDAMIREKLEGVMERFQMTEWAEMPLHHLSLGQKRRVALAGVMVMEPELLLLDEPTAYLDQGQTQSFVQELERIHTAGTTILMATHDVDLAFAWADWIFVMEKGQLVLEGVPEAVFSDRDRLAGLQLRIPAVYEVWQALPDALREQVDADCIPRTSAELAARLRAVSNQADRYESVVMQK